MTDRHAAYPTGLKDAPTRHRALRRRMEAPGIVVAPGAYDCITARSIERKGPALLFENIKGYPGKSLVTNIYSLFLIPYCCYGEIRI